MIKRVLVGVVILVVAASAGLFFWVRAVFTQDAVRTAFAAQLSRSIGQTVTIGSIGAGIYPRVTVNLGEVSIGQPARIQIRTLKVGTDFGALLSRRIEHASLRLAGARVELPLPDFAMASSYTIHSRPEDKAFAAFPVMNPAPQHLFRSGNECATDRASAVFGSTGNMLGYECFNYSGG